jgi:hypothetical protein
MDVAALKRQMSRLRPFQIRLREKFRQVDVLEIELRGYHLVNGERIEAGGAEVYTVRR